MDEERESISEKKIFDINVIAFFLRQIHVCLTQAYLYENAKRNDKCDAMANEKKRSKTNEFWSDCGDAMVKATVSDRMTTANVR